MSEAVAMGARAKLYADSDNWAALQALLDVYTDVRLPAGIWPISKCLNLKQHGTILRGYGMEKTELKNTGTTGGPVLGTGGHGQWDGGTGYGAVNNVTITGLTLWQTDNSATNNKCLFNNIGDNFTMRKVRVKGSSYEGIVSSSNCRYVTLKDIHAINCGNGGPAYGLSTAGINATSQDLLIDGFSVSGCGQGIETGNTGVIVRNGIVADPGAGTPSIGINIGSSGWGVYNVLVERCIVAGYDFAIGTGNGIGRLAKVIIRNNTIWDDGESETQAAPIGFSGGIDTNSVQHDNQGPDTEGSEITDNIIYISAPHQGAISYNTVPNSDGRYGREPLLIARNKIYLVGDSSLQTHPFINFAGKITAECQVIGNLIFNTNTPPNRGDIQSNSLTGNAAVPGFPTLSYRDNMAFTSANATRGMTFNIEGA